MFSFHKPKVYRSTQGCCICKAKSSSSRFTDSKKYEFDFIECFQLQITRKGEICNACVLLVKRFKRLPPGSERHWGHVVDARVGPGLKSMTKFKKRREEQQQQQQQQQQSLNNENNIVSDQTTNSTTAAATITTTASSTTANSVSRSLSSMPEKFCKIFKKNKKKKQGLAHHHHHHIIDSKKNIIQPAKIEYKFRSFRGDSIDSNNHEDEDNKDSLMSSLAESKFSSICTTPPPLNSSAINRNFIDTILNVHENKISKNHYRRKSMNPKKNRHFFSNNKNVSIVDLNIWKMVKTCCGYVYEHTFLNAVLLDVDLVKVCSAHRYDDRLNYKTTKPVTTFNHEKENLMNMKFSDSVNVPTTACKKHHLYSKRQNIIDPTNLSRSAVEFYSKQHQPQSIPQLLIPTQNDIKIIFSKQQQSSIGPLKYIAPLIGGYNLHKLNAESKIIKNINSVEKIMHPIVASAKLKTNDYNLMKNLVKICTDKSISNKLKTIGVVGAGGGGVVDGVIVDGLANKFSDNSSDSGYEDQTPVEQQINLTQKLRGVRSVVLANGIKVHVQPQNLSRAVNWAGVPQQISNLQADNIQMISPNIHHNNQQHIIGQKIVINSSNNIINNQQSVSNLNNILISNQSESSTTTTTNTSNNILIKPKYLQQIA